jgi:O-antigen/teichoic acid export membrane protein
VSTKHKVYSAASWSVASIVALQLLRLFSSVFTARLLLPADFGLLAVTSAVLAFFDRISYLGVDSALVQRKEVTELDLDVAWTFEFIRRNAIALLFLACAPLLGRWVSDPRVFVVMLMNWLCVFVSTWRNNGMVIFRRELQFRPIFFSEFVPAVFSCVMTIGLLLVWRDIMALLVSMLCSAVVGVVTTYVLHPHRPRFQLQWARLKEFLAFGSCMLGGTIVEMIRNQGVTLALARLVGTTKLGYYDRANNFSLSLFSQVQFLLWRVGYPVFSSEHHSERGLQTHFKHAVVLSLMAAPALCLGYAVIAPDLIPLLLTAKWASIIPLMQLFCVQALLMLLLVPAEIAFQAIGRPGLGTLNQGITCALFLALLYPFMQAQGLAGLIMASIAASLCTLPLYLVQVRRHVLCFPWGSVWQVVLPVVAASGAMWGAYALLGYRVESAGARLLWGIPLAALVYLGLLGAAVRWCAPLMRETLAAVVPERWRGKSA